MAWAIWQMSFFSALDSYGSVPSVIAPAAKSARPTPTKAAVSRRPGEQHDTLEHNQQPSPVGQPSIAAEVCVSRWWSNLMRQHVLPPKLLKGGLCAWLESPRWSQKHQLPAIPWLTGDMMWQYLQRYSRAIAETELAQLGRTKFYWSALHCSDDLRRSLEQVAQHFSRTQHCSFAPLYLYCRELICLQFWKEQLCQDHDSWSKINIGHLDRLAQEELQKLNAAFQDSIGTYHGYMEQSLQHLSQMAFGLLTKSSATAPKERYQPPQGQLQKSLRASTMYVQHSLMGAELFRRSHGWLLHIAVAGGHWHNELAND